jgi:biopolymer transport protein ExbB/TolQ
MLLHFIFRFAKSTALLYEDRRSLLIAHIPYLDFPKKTPVIKKYLFFTLTFILILMVFWSPNSQAQMKMNQRQSNQPLRENKNANQLNQAIREMHLQRMKERQAKRKIDNQIEKQNNFEEVKREKRDNIVSEKKERFMERMNALSPEERQALRKQIKEARMQIYEKTEKQ